MFFLVKKFTICAAKIFNNILFKGIFLDAFSFYDIHYAKKF